MTHRVAAEYPSRQDAEAARKRLEALGVRPQWIIIRREGGEQAEGSGMFDRLAGYLAPGGIDAPGAYLLEAEVWPEQLARATRLLREDETFEAEAGETRLRENVIEMAETVEELVVEKQAVVTEEVILSRRAQQHVEDVHETVRRTEVEVERFSPPEPHDDKVAP